MYEEDRNLPDYNDFDSIIVRYEEMLKNGKRYYFDVEDFEQILDYYIDVNHLGKALRAVKYAFNLHPYAISLSIKKAQILLKDQNPKRALAALNNIESLEASNNELYVTKGHANVMLGNTKEAKKEYKKALELITDDDEAVDLLQNIAQTFQFVDEYNIALRYLLKASELDRYNIFVLQDLAYCYEKLQQPDLSLKYYKQYLDVDPFSDHTWYSIARIYKESGKVDEAIEAYEYAIAINPKSTESIYELAVLFEENFQYKKAVKFYLEYIELDDDSAEVLFSIANCYNYLDNNKSALEFYRKVLKIDAYNPQIHYGIATIFFKMENYWDALFHAKRATIIDNENSSYYILYGRIASKLNLSSEAIEAFENALEIKPNFLYNLVLLIDELIKIRQYKKTQKCLENSLEFHDDSALVLFRLAGLYFLNNNKRNAFKYFRKGMKVDPNLKSNFFKLCPDAKDSKEVSKLLKETTYKNQ